LQDNIVIKGSHYIISDQLVFLGQTTPFAFWEELPETGKGQSTALVPKTWVKF
jgi:hypothetical protein